MPTYDYVCRKCHAEMEIFQSMLDEPLTKCPECGKNGLQRQIGTGAGIIFKGSGFYCTDYRSDSYQKGAEKDKSAVLTSSSSSSDSKKDSKKDSKPDSKPKAAEKKAAATS